MEKQVLTSVELTEEERKITVPTILRIREYQRNAEHFQALLREAVNGFQPVIGLMARSRGLPAEEYLISNDGNQLVHRSTQQAQNTPTETK